MLSQVQLHFADQCCFDSNCLRRQPTGPILSDCLQWMDTSLSAPQSVLGSTLGRLCGQMLCGWGGLLCLTAKMDVHLNPQSSVSSGVQQSLVCLGSFCPASCPSLKKHCSLQAQMLTQSYRFQLTDPDYVPKWTAAVGSDVLGCCFGS